MSNELSSTQYAAGEAMAAEINGHTCSDCGVVSPAVQGASVRCDACAAAWVRRQEEALEDFEAMPTTRLEDLAQRLSVAAGLEAEGVARADLYAQDPECATIASQRGGYAEALEEIRAELADRQ